MLRRWPYHIAETRFVYSSVSLNSLLSITNLTALSVCNFLLYLISHSLERRFLSQKIIIVVFPSSAFCKVHFQLVYLLRPSLFFRALDILGDFLRHSQRVTVDISILLDQSCSFVKPLRAQPCKSKIFSSASQSLYVVFAIVSPPIVVCCYLCFSFCHVIVGIFPHVACWRVG